jgi:hypothetical protein
MIITRMLRFRLLPKLPFVLAAILLSFLILHPSPGIANHHIPSAGPDIALDPQDFKQFEGYYKFQFEKGQDSYIHITATEKGLLLKQIWDGKEIGFTPLSSLEFKNEDGSFNLKFTKGGNGAITQVLAMDRDLWIKTNDYERQTTKEVSLAPAQLKALAGRYTFQFEKGQDAFIEIRATEKGIILKQVWDGKEIPFIAQSDLDFYNKEAQFPLRFTKDKSGKAIQVLAFNRDLWNRVKE